LRSFIDGVPLDLASSLLPATTRLRPGLLIHLHLHATAQRVKSPSRGGTRATTVSATARGDRRQAASNGGVAGVEAAPHDVGRLLRGHELHGRGLRAQARAGLVRDRPARAEDVFDAYTQEEFERAFGRHFEILESTPLRESVRTIYVMRRR
jgi:hypothetical protein